MSIYKSLNLAEEKLFALEQIAIGRNLFITGCAGVGKTHLLNIIKDKYQKSNLHIVASTGIAAVHIGGMTLHSWAGLGGSNRTIDEIVHFVTSSKGNYVRKRLKQVKILAIDEISMISAHTFNLLNNLLKIIRKNELSFGGIQIILFGDFLQLPPVDKQPIEAFFCFESTAWWEANIKIICLYQVFRQQEQILIQLLNKLRFNQLEATDLEILKNRTVSAEQDKIKPTIICTHNKQIELINNNKLAQINQPSYEFRMQEEGDLYKIAFLKKNCLASELLVLKEKAQVMMLKNTYYKDKIINGSIGLVVGFSIDKLPLVAFGNKVITVEPEEWQIEEYNDLTQRQEVKAKIKQLPLALAWAITVHKSQGMSLDKIECDLSHAFEEGQIYVALSRVKTLGGLYLKNFKPNLIKVNSKVVEFYQSLINQD